MSRVTEEGAMAEVRKDPIPAELLKLVQRPKTDSKGQVVLEKSGKEEVPVLRAIKASEVFAWREYEDRVVVTTRDGQKYVGVKGG